MIRKNDLGEVKARVQVPYRERQVDRQPLDDAFAKFHAWHSIIQPKAPCPSEVRLAPWRERKLVAAEDTRHFDYGWQRSMSI